MRPKVTIADVARAAGVSTSTVSHVLNETRWVNPDTADNVRSVVDRIGYRPNTLARSLASKASNSIGIAMSTTVNPYFNEVAGTIERAASGLGFMVFQADTEESPDRELAVVKALHGMQVGGIILSPTTSGFNKAVEYLKTHTVPTVLVDRVTINSSFDYVGSENVESLARLVALLTAQGHRRIGIALGQKNFSTSDERLEGYRIGLKTAGVPFDPSLVVEDCASLDTATQAIAGVLRNARPSAFIGGNNLTSIAIVAAARINGLSIPKDLSVAGFDDFEWASFFEPRLTLLAQGWQSIGQQAAELLVGRMKGSAEDPQMVRFQPNLTARDSIAELRLESTH